VTEMVTGRFVDISHSLLRAEPLQVSSCSFVYIYIYISLLPLLFPINIYTDMRIMLKTFTLRTKHSYNVYGNQQK
jgi:hypothetical protein